MKLEVFKDIVIFKYRDISNVLHNTNRNVTNTYAPLLNFVEEFEAHFEDNKSIVIYSENGESEIGMCDVALYDLKNKSFIIESDEFYYKLDDIYKMSSSL